MADAIDKAVRAQGGAVVKPHQVKAMILAARRAYSEQAKAGLVDDGVDFDAWRRATLHDVVGAAAPDSFRAVTQRDYAAVVEYFGWRGIARRREVTASVQQQATRCGGRSGRWGLWREKWRMPSGGARGRGGTPTRSSRGSTRPTDTPPRRSRHGRSFSPCGTAPRKSAQKRP